MGYIMVCMDSIHAVWGIYGEPKEGKYSMSFITKDIMAVCLEDKILN